MLGAASPAAGAEKRGNHLLPVTPKSAAAQAPSRLSNRSRVGDYTPSGASSSASRRGVNFQRGITIGDSSGRTRSSNNKRRTNSAGRGAAAGKETSRRYANDFMLDDDDFSPRLSSIEASNSEPLGAPLLPPPHSHQAEPEERFCTGGPNIDGPGRLARTSSKLLGNETFGDLVSRLEAAMGQASLLLSDRLRALKSKFQAGINFTYSQESELCEIADGVAAAAYHVQKWGFLLLQKSDQQAKKPTKPPRSESAEEAFAAVHFALPRLMVSAAEAHRGLAAAVKLHGDRAEAKVRLQGIPIEDLRAIAPHLERLLLRLGRLSSLLRPPEKLHHFVPQYFAPAIGWKAARLLREYLFAGYSLGGAELDA